MASVRASMLCVLALFAQEVSASKYAGSNHAKPRASLVPDSEINNPSFAEVSHPFDSETMFCATPLSAAGYVGDRKGCTCKFRDTQNMSQENGWRHLWSSQSECSASTWIAQRAPLAAHCQNAEKKDVPAWEEVRLDATTSHIAVSVMSGAAVRTRAIACAKTWLKEFPNRVVVSDTQIAELQGLVDVVAQGGKGWQGANDRMLDVPATLHDKFPDASWYLMVDDDTVIFAESLLKQLSKYPNPRTTPYYIGMSTHDTGREIDYIFGGAGILMSHAAVAKVKPLLSSGKCSEAVVPRPGFKNDKVQPVAGGDGFNNDKLSKTGDIRLGRCFQLAGVAATCNQGFSQWGGSPADLSDQDVSRHYVTTLDAMQQYMSRKQALQKQR